MTTKSLHLQVKDYLMPNRDKQTLKESDWLCYFVVKNSAHMYMEKNSELNLTTNL